jgi:hypothetical protein
MEVDWLLPDHWVWRPLAQGTKDSGTQPSSGRNLTIPPKDRGKNPRISRTDPCVPRGLPRPYSIVSGSLLLLVFSLETAELFRFQGKIIMSLVYGYDLKENDKMVEAPVQLANISGSFYLTWSSSSKLSPIPYEPPSCDRRWEEELTTTFSATYPFVGPLAQL